MADDSTPAVITKAHSNGTPTPPKGFNRYAEIGTTGLQHSGGFVVDEFLPNLSGARLTKTIREMVDNDPVIGALLFAIDMLIRQVDWRIDPAEPASVDEILAERRAERAKAQQAAKEAEAAREAMAQAAASGMAGEGGPGASPKPAPKPPATTTSGKKVSKAAEMLFDSPYLSTAEKFDLWKAENTAAEAEARAEKNDTDTATGFSTAQADDAERWAVFVETCLHDMATPWPETISQILSMLPFGFHYAEIVYKQRRGPSGKDRTHSRFDDNKVGWRKFAPRAQETRFRWEITEKGDCLGMWQLDPTSGHGTVFIPIEKALLFRTENRKGNPEGRSVLRNAYRPWYFKKRIEEIEAIGIERDLAGLPVAWVPPEMLSPNATTEQKAALAAIKEIVRNIKRDEQEGVVWPLAHDPETNQKMYDLTLLSTGGQRQFDTDKIIARYDQRLAMIVLADFILLGHEQVGSFALGQTKADLFTAALEAWLNVIAEVFNTHAIPRLMRANGVDPALSPRLAHGRLTQVDLAALGDYVTKISQAGAPLFPDDNLETYLREVAGLPARETGEDL